MQRDRERTKTTHDIIFTVTDTMFCEVCVSFKKIVYPYVDLCIYVHLSYVRVTVFSKQLRNELGEQNTQTHRRLCRECRSLAATGAAPHSVQIHTHTHTFHDIRAIIRAHVRPRRSALVHEQHEDIFRTYVYTIFRNTDETRDTRQTAYKRSTYIAAAREYAAFFFFCVCCVFVRLHVFFFYIL